MAFFPKLKTGAVAQYPAKRTMSFQNQILRFIDGAEQRYRDACATLHQWEICLKALDEGELVAIENFFLQNQGRFGTFEFTDPRDGRVYPNCSLMLDELELTGVEEVRGKTTLRVAENRMPSC